MAKDRILCLHGSGTSAEILQHQLQPLVKALKDEELGTEMVFAQGDVTAGPAPGIGSVYGEGPYYSFFSWSDPPTGADLSSVAEAYQLIYDIIEDEGPFDGILGFSQGATLASAFILHHAERNPFDLPFVHFKYAIFIAGTPPRMSDSEDLLPSPESVVMIPTAHVAGKLDPAYEESMELFRMSDNATATLTTHELGHLIPRDLANLRPIVKSIVELHHKAIFV